MRPAWSAPTICANCSPPPPHAGAKTVLVGDAHQLAPVKARGGMFAQLCADLPWTQRLSEVWRMRDPDERSASLALRDGGPAPVRRAVEWYRTHDRLHTGDPIAMAADALAAYRADTAAGKDALLVCDTTEMADALNRRLHDDTIDAEAPTVTAARGQRIGVGDLIISRRNDPTIGVFDATDITQTGRSGAQRQPLAGLRRRHRPQHRGSPPAASTTAPAPPSPATICVSTSPTATPSPCTPPRASPPTPPTPCSAKTPRRALLYVAMTRGRDTNTAYLYERIAGEGDHEHAQPTPGVHVARRGTSRDAAHLVRGIIANHDEQARTAHHIAAETPDPDQLPDRVQWVLDRRAKAVATRRNHYQAWCRQTSDWAIDRQLSRDQQLSQSRDQSLDYGLEL